MKFTASVEYRVMRCILNHNDKSHTPKLADILSEVNFTSRNTVEVCLNHLKHRGLVKTIGDRHNFSYYLTSNGVTEVRNFEEFETKELMLTLAKLQCYGD